MDSKQLDRAEGVARQILAIPMFGYKAEELPGALALLDLATLGLQRIEELRLNAKDEALAPAQP